MLYPDSFIVNLDSLNIPGSEQNIHSLVSNSSQYIFVEGNICDYDLVMHILKTYEIDIVVHFASRDHVADPTKESWKFIQDNIVGTHTLLEACKTYGELDKFIHICTDKVYGETTSSESPEQWVVCPMNPYAASKASAELMAISYYHTFKLPVVLARLNHVYGLHQSPTKILPTFISLLNQNKKIKIRGDGLDICAFTHVYDVTNAIDLIILDGVLGETYQIDNKADECSILDIAKGLILLMVNDKFRTPAEFEPYLEFVHGEEKEKKRYFVHDRKLAKLGWIQEIPFIEGVIELIKQLSTK